MQKPSKLAPRRIERLPHLSLALIEGGAGIGEAMSGPLPSGGSGGGGACAYCSGLAKRPIYH